LAGYANLAAVVGVPMETLLAQWSAALYVDDRVSGAAARLTIPSWNLVSIESGLVASAHLTPIDMSFGAFDDARQVRDGSTEYYRVSSAGAHGAVAIRARSSGGTTLPTPMTLWVVRIQ
jgi:hypothetical protein